MEGQLLQENDFEYEVYQDTALFSGFLFSPMAQICKKVDTFSGLEQNLSWGAYYLRLVKAGAEIPVKRGDVIKMRFVVDCREAVSRYSMKVMEVGARKVDLRFEWCGVASGDSLNSDMIP